MTDTDPVYPPLRKRSKHGFRGYPIGTVAFYGPTDSRASKVAVGILRAEGEEISDLKRWSTTKGDIRRDPRVGDAVMRFLKQSGAATVVMTDRIIGCPHEEGTDYPEGHTCPECPFWATRDRWSGESLVTT